MTQYLLGPLTTTFTPPARCLPGSLGPPVGYTCAPTGTLMILDLSCLPELAKTRPGLVTFDVNHVLSNTIGYYSPGLVCPSGWTSACEYDGIDNTSLFPVPPGPGDRVTGCCPSYVSMLLFSYTFECR